MQSPDILELIKAHADRLEVEAPPVQFDELWGPSRPPLRRTGSWSGLRGVSVAIGVAVIVLALVGGAVVLFSALDPAEPPAADTVPTSVAADLSTTTSSPPTSSATTADPSTTTSVVGVPIPVSWSRVDTDMTARSIAAGPGGLVAVDTIGLGGDGAIVWSSDDGVGWTAHAFPHSAIDSVAGDDAGYVVSGGSWDLDIAISADGVSWIPADHVDDGVWRQDLNGDPAPGTYGTIEAVTRGPETYVAVGSARDYHNEDGNVFYGNPRAAVWTSSDGRVWTRLPDQEVFDGPWHQDMYDIAYGGAGFVAVGSSEGDDDSTSVGAIWHSPDGFSWTRVPHDDDLFGAFEAGSWSSVYEVAYGHSGYVALGSAVLVSSDGLTWSAVEDDSLAPSAGGVSVGMNDVAHGDGVYVIVGAEWLIDETVTDAEDPSRRLLRPAAWWSTDAVHWTQVAGLTDILSGGDGPGPSEVAYSNGRFVVVGFEVLWLDHPYGGPTMVGHVWIGEPEA